ncbi:MAG: hypothetical protein ACI8S6_004234 [Myxococcota bacterium]|jgi:hypothetical protein
MTTTDPELTHHTHTPRRSRRGVCLFLLAACSAGGTDTTSETEDAPFSQDSPDPPDASFTVTWGEDTVEVVIAQGEGGQFWFGAADLTLNDSWTGEDCYLGDERDGERLRYCHPVGEAGAILQRGGDPLKLLVGLETALDAGSAERAAYYFFEVRSEGCWIGGPRSSYFADICDNEGAVVVQ